VPAIMSNIPAVNALITAINFDRFAEIEARHAPDAVFTSFRGPTLRSSVSIADWHREFLRDYQDCNYAELEYIEQDNVVAVRATIEAKGYDWRPFTQRVIEVFEFSDAGNVVGRRLYGMLRNIELDKAAAASMADAQGYKGGSASATRATMEKLLAAIATADMDGIKEQTHEKATVIDGVFGVATGVENLVDLIASRPAPSFGTERVTRLLAGEHDALLELAIDPSRPRLAQWFRLVDDKVRVVEAYWMLREIGVNPYENLAGDRHARRAILPI
jgi:hypothetical protein